MSHFSTTAFVYQQYINPLVRGGFDDKFHKSICEEMLLPVNASELLENLEDMSPQY